MKNKILLFILLIVFSATPLTTVRADDESQTADQAADAAVKDMSDILPPQNTTDPAPESDSIDPNEDVAQPVEEIQPASELAPTPKIEEAAKPDAVPAPAPLAQPVQAPSPIPQAELVVAGPVQPSNFEFLRNAILQNHRKKFWLEQERLEAFKRGDRSSVRELAGEINQLKQKDKELHRSLSTAVS